MQDIKIYKSVVKAKILIVVCSIFVFLGILTIDYGHKSLWMKYSGICLFGLGILVGLVQLFDNRPQIIINEEGIFDRMGQKQTIKWEMIKDAYLANFSRQPYICIDVYEKFKPSRNKGRLYGIGAKFMEFIGGQEISISLGQLNINREKLKDFILQMRDATKEERKDILKSIALTDAKT